MAVQATNDELGERFIDDLLARMTLEQKVGQCFTVHWGGTLITPYVVEAIRKLHVGGLRVTPFGQNSRRGKHYHQDLSYDYDYPAGRRPIRQNLFLPGACGYVSPEQYAERLNHLQELARERDPGIPLHVSIDQEGDISHDFAYGGIHLFPSVMGLTATGDPERAYETCRAVARQLRALGVTNIHSPVLDVNLDPRNPEINIRAYGDDPDTVARYAAASMRGLHDGGLVATAKHFPGRGDSSIDAHAELPVVAGDRARLEQVELYPYRALIADGLQSIMLAHTAVPAIDGSMEISTVSRPIVTGLLREEMGFEGVVTTDSITMGALMRKYGVAKACAKAIEAGCDLVLNKTEDEFRDQAFWELYRFVEDGTIPQTQLDASVRRVLRMKLRAGLFDTAGRVAADQAVAPIRDRQVIELARTVAAECLTVLRDDDKLLPLRADQRIMVVEQQILAGYAGCDVHCHDKAFNAAMYEQSLNVIGLDTAFKASADDESFIMGILAEQHVDVIVATNYYWRLCPHNNTTLIQRLLARGHKVVVVTNCPYELGAVPEAPTVICNYGATPEGARAAARVLFGQEKPRGQWPLRHYALPTHRRAISHAARDDAATNEVTGVVF